MRIACGRNMFNTFIDANLRAQNVALIDDYVILPLLSQPVYVSVSDDVVELAHLRCGASKCTRNERNILK